MFFKKCSFMSCTCQCKRQWTHSIHRLNSHLSISLLVYLIFKIYYCGCNVVIMNNTVWTCAVGVYEVEKACFHRTRSTRWLSYLKWLCQMLWQGSMIYVVRCVLVFEEEVMMDRCLSPHLPHHPHDWERTEWQVEPALNQIQCTVACKTRSVVKASCCFTCVEHCFVDKNCKVMCIYF